MSNWVVRAAWIEDDAEVSERWIVDAATAYDAIREASSHVRFPPHHVEARRPAAAEEEAAARGLRPHQVSRLDPG